MKTILYCSTVLCAAIFGLTAMAQAQTDVHPVSLEAKSLPLSDVRITGGPLATAQDLDAKYLLELEPDRMLYWLRVRAGLKGKADSGYGGWDKGTDRELTGHIAGHYLSAISYMYAATGNPEFKRRADYMVSELKEVQDAQGDGYIGALMASPPRQGRGGRRGAGTNNAATAGGRRGGNTEFVNGKERFEAIKTGTIQSGGFDLNGMWSPWYVEHKIFAGLRDAYHYTGNRTALEVEIKFAGWVESVVGKLTPQQDQHMLETEYGGMNEVLADLYHDTGDARWLALSDRFEHRSVLVPMALHNDILGHKHGNTLIPQFIGSLSRYIYTGNETDGEASQFFWNQVVYHHSYATGGHGHNEYFDPADDLSKDVDGRDDESCNVYNMLKMTREMFEIHPEEQYAAFMERALFNHVLGSIDPTNGRMCYMVPVGRNATHEYQDMFDDFTCCVGTGMENHALYGDGLFYESTDPSVRKLWVNFYTPATANWADQQVKLDMATTFPEGDKASLKFTVNGNDGKTFTLAVRRPDWAGRGFTVTVNGGAVASLPKAGSYVDITRAWKTGDTVALVLPKQLHEEALPDNPDRVALMWGPLVLAGDMGPESRRSRGGGRTSDAPVLVSEGMPMADWLKPAPGNAGDFQTVGVGQSHDVLFVPFYREHERTYEVYFDTFTPAAWARKSPEFAAETAREEKLKLATVGFVQPGQMQAERDANEQASSPEESTPETTMGHYGRRGSKWFSFDIAVDPSHPMTLICTYYADEWRKSTADVLVDGTKVGEQNIPAQGEPKFFDVEYKIPASLMAGKTKVTVRFEATQNNGIGAVYGLRMVRADMGS